MSDLELTGLTSRLTEKYLTPVSAIGLLSRMPKDSPTVCVVDHSGNVLSSVVIPFLHKGPSRNRDDDRQCVAGRWLAG
jgi:hypothetical protein